ncbi:Rv3654c family TadE-like protein [Actinomycetes bacterium KLBMP 9797]
MTARAPDAPGARRGLTMIAGEGRRPRDRGAATLWVLAIGLVLVVAGMAGASVGAARVARHEARVAADLGALAGAMRVLGGAEVACARAAEVVARNGGRLTQCAVDGFDLIVAVEVPVTPMPGLTRTARGEARAGPARTPL